MNMSCGTCPARHMSCTPCAQASLRSHGTGPFGQGRSVPPSAMHGFAALRSCPHRAVAKRGLGIRTLMQHVLLARCSLAVYPRGCRILLFRVQHAPPPLSSECSTCCSMQHGISTMLDTNTPFLVHTRPVLVRTRPVLVRTVLVRFSSARG